MTSSARRPAAQAHGAFELDCASMPTTLGPGDQGSCTADVHRHPGRPRRRIGGQPGRASRLPIRKPDPARTSVGDVHRRHQPLQLSLDKTVAERLVRGQRGCPALHDHRAQCRQRDLHQVRIVDPSPGPGAFTTDCATITALAPGESVVCQATYTVTAGDLTRAELTNTVRAAAPGQVEAMTASATSNPEGSVLPSTGATRDFTALIGAGAGPAGGRARSDCSRLRPSQSIPGLVGSGFEGRAQARVRHRGSHR